MLNLKNKTRLTVEVDHMGGRYVMLDVTNPDGRKKLLHTIMTTYAVNGFVYVTRFRLQTISAIYSTFWLQHTMQRYQR